MIPKKNVLIVNGSFAGGGANQIAHTLYESLKSQYRMSGLVGDRYMPDSNIYSMATNHFLYPQLEKFALYASILTGAQYLAGKYLLNRNYKSLASIKAYTQADLIHLHNLHGMNFNLDLLPQISATKPVIWTLQDEWSFTGHCAKTMRCIKWQEAECQNCPFLRRYSPIYLDTSNYFYRRKRSLYQKSSFHLVAASNWLASKIKSSILAKFPLSVIHNGADTDIFKPANRKALKQKLGLPQGKFVISFIANHGNKNPWKGSQFVQEIVRRKVSPDFLFLSIGNPLANKVSRNYWELPFISDRSRLAEYYAASDILIHPSLADTCPLTVFEALACGTPVVAFSTEGIVEMIDHRKDGYLAGYKDIDDLIKGINFFYDNPEKRKAAGTLGRRKVVKSFTLKHMVKKYSDLYSSVLRSQRTGL